MKKILFREFQKLRYVQLFLQILIFSSLKKLFIELYLKGFFINVFGFWYITSSINTVVY